MSDPTPSIVEAQDQATARNLRRAAGRLRERARAGTPVWVLLVLVPAALAVTKTAWEPATPAAVFYALAIMLAATLGFGRRPEKLRRAAARALEYHDCTVLDLVWNARAAGPEPTDEELSDWQGAADDGATGGAIDPFPIELARLDLPFARVACQNLAVRWDAAAGRLYLKRLWQGLGAVTVVVVAGGLALRPQPETAATSLIALAPVAYWIWRQRTAFREADRLADRVAQRAGSAWRNAMARSIQAPALASVARGVQDDIFAFRAAEPLPPRWAAGRWWGGGPGIRATVDRLEGQYERLQAESG